MKISGADLFVKALKEEKVDTLFAYPGGQAIDLFNALYGTEGINVILPRHEQGLIHAADGYSRSTGKVGVCLVTSGPGATNLVTGIATANYDSVPLVCFTGQVPTHLIGNDAFQEVDIVGITRSISEYAITVRKRIWQRPSKRHFILQNPVSPVWLSLTCQKISNRKWEVIFIPNKLKLGVTNQTLQYILARLKRHWNAWGARINHYSF